MAGALGRTKRSEIATEPARIAAMMPSDQVTGNVPPKTSFNQTIWLSG